MQSIKFFTLNHMVEAENELIGKSCKYIKLNSIFSQYNWTFDQITFPFDQHKRLVLFTVISPAYFSIPRHNRLNCVGVFKNSPPQPPEQKCCWLREPIMDPAAMMNISSCFVFNPAHFHSKKSGNTKACTAAYRGGWLMTCCHDVWDPAYSRSTWRTKAMKCCSSFRRLLLRSLGINKGTGFWGCAECSIRNIPRHLHSRDLWL